MSTHPLTRFSPSRLGSDATQLLNRTATLARVLVDLLADDMDGDDATEVVALSYRGVDYEMDLTEKRASALDHLLSPYLAGARRVTAKRAVVRRRAATTKVSQDPREIRAWAKNQGIVIADRGRVSAEVMRRYREAHRG
jgi:Lsr2